MKEQKRNIKMIKMETKSDVLCIICLMWCHHLHKWVNYLMKNITRFLLAYNFVCWRISIDQEFLIPKNRKYLHANKKVYKIRSFKWEMRNEEYTLKISFQTWMPRCQAKVQLSRGTLPQLSKFLIKKNFEKSKMSDRDKF